MRMSAMRTSLAWRESFAVTLCVGLPKLILLPVMGGLADRVGRLPLLIGASRVGLATGYP